MPYITHCPTCQCRIMVMDGVTKSHDNYVECLEALKTEQVYLTNRIIVVMQLEIKKRNELQEQLNKAYELESES